MHLITRSCVLFLWMHALTFVKSQDCTREQFLNSRHYDSNFDISNLEASYPGGGQVRVSCNVGYSGFFKLMCVEGKWEHKGSKCQPKSCGHPGDGQFSDFHLEKGNDFVFGSQVVYTCQKGYQMQSRTNFRRCMAEGWDGVVPVCEAQQCPVIHVANNVHVIGDPEEATYGNVVRFSCKSHSEILYGSTEVLCDENGEWSAEPPKCKEVTCTAPEIEHGIVSGGVREYKEHDVLHFTCNLNYKRAEERLSKCTKLGSRAEWSPTPACAPITCGPLQRLPGTSYEPAYRNIFSPGETVTVTCGEKYWINSHKSTSVVTTCQGDGSWTINPSCKEIICSRPQYPLLKSWGSYYSRQQIKLDETEQYACKTGYKRTDGVSRATCTRDGWRPNPLCEEITCNKQVFKNADIVNDKQEYKYNEQANYVCKDGYQGRFSQTCGERGWTRSSQCTAITCQKVVIENAEIVSSNKWKYDYNYDEQVKYVCKSGYPQSFFRTCGDNGWTGPSQCASCSNTEVPNGFSVGPFNDTLYYSCNEGYKLFTKAWWGQVKCNDGKPVRCIEQGECGEMPVIANMEVTQPWIYRQGESVQIRCKEGYQAGEGHLNCHEGKWHPNGTICTPVTSTCGPPPKVENAVILTPYQKEYMSDSEVAYECRKTYTMEGNGTIQCIDGKWHPSINCSKPITCQKEVIENAEIVSNNKWKSNYKYNERVKYVCKNGNPKGFFRTCGHNGWTGPSRCISPTLEQ